MILPLPIIDCTKRGSTSFNSIAVHVSVDVNEQISTEIGAAYPDTGQHLVFNWIHVCPVNEYESNIDSFAVLSLLFFSKNNESKYESCVKPKQWAERQKNILLSCGEISISAALRSVFNCPEQDL